MKTFKDLKFKVFIEYENSLQDTTRAQIKFENGYGVSVIFGYMCSGSNGIDKYELRITYNDEPLMDGLHSGIKVYQITRLMKRLQTILQ